MRSNERTHPIIPGENSWIRSSTGRTKERSTEEIATGEEVENGSLNHPHPSPIDGLFRHPPEQTELMGDSLERMSAFWSRTVHRIAFPFLLGIKYVSLKAVEQPRTFLAWPIILSIVLLLVGLATNFSVDVNEDTIWTPMGSKPDQHGKWLKKSSGFPQMPRTVHILIHSHGGNVLGVDGVRRCFKALDMVRDTPGYEELCQMADYSMIDFETGKKTCEVEGVTRFWDNDIEIFESINYTNEGVVEALSNHTYPDGEPVSRAVIFGRLEVEGNNTQTGRLISSLAFNTYVQLPSNVDASRAFESDMLDRVLWLRKQWKAEKGNPHHLEVFAERTTSDEVTGAIMKDIFLIPLVFLGMSIFCIAVFARRDCIRSQSLVGFGAVVSVLLSIMSGYGLLFVIGVPFTSLTQILPFIMFGIGLDDTFIIMGSFNRKDLNKGIAERVEETMDEIGKSIFITTITSSVAFGLGAISSIPAVRWLCFYAFPTIMIDFVYQITFFIAILTIDDGRMKDGRRDCIVWYKATRDPGHESGSGVEEERQMVLAEKIMSRNSELLLRPVAKALVVVFFTAMMGVLAWSASELTVKFDFKDVLPSDSYAADYGDYSELYTLQQVYKNAFIFFRDVDFSKEETWNAMDTFVDAIVDLEQVSSPPAFYWLDDFRMFKESGIEGRNQSFEVQMELFLNDSVYNKLYFKDIVLDEKGVMTASRTSFCFDRVLTDKVKEQVDALKAQRDVTKAQPVNWNQKDWKFFTFGESYYMWEFVSVAVEELILVTVLGVTAVSAIGMLFIPHWSAVLFVGPLVCILYVDLLGFVQFCGLHVNPVTYVAMVLSIGLMVDYVMHVTFKYYESKGNTRDEKIKVALNTIGVSILVGGLTTMLGVIPLAFSTSGVIWSVFVVFIGLVLLGITHGLIFLPVVLSLTGPTAQV